MELPSLYSLSGSRSALMVFGGLNESYACGEAEFTQMQNFSSRGYPALQTRTPRRTMKTLDKCNGMYHLNGLLLCEGTTLRYREDNEDSDAAAIAETETVLENAVEDSEKIMIGMGTKILIWPDAVSFDTAARKLERLSAAWDQGGNTVTIAPCDTGGKTYTVSQTGTTEPGSPTDGTLFLKQNSSASKWAYVSVLEQYDAKTGKWVEIVLNSVKMTLPGLAAAGFKKGDTITVSHVPDVVKQYLADGVNGEVSVQQMDGDSIVLIGTPNTESSRYFGSFTVTAGSTVWKSLDGKETASAGGAAITARRRVPKLEYVTENSNRVWGCNSEENTIYSCKLGDPTNWYSYNGIASDSYAVNVGSDGPFTGAATCMGYVLFFKENGLHKLYGSRQADYQLVSVQCRGVAKGASKSLCVLAEVLYYLSPDGVMAWDGSLPVKISGGLTGSWLVNVREAVGGVMDTRYYLHLKVPSRKQTRLLVYDTERRLWHEEDTAGETEMNGWAMCSTGRQLYQWDGKTLWATEPDYETDRDSDAAKAGLETTVRFDAVSGDIGLKTPADKYISRVTLRVDALAYSVVTLQASYDGGAWETLGEAAVLKKYTRVNLPFMSARHDTMRLRLTGTGQIAVRSIAFTLAQSRGNRVMGGEPKK